MDKQLYAWHKLDEYELNNLSRDNRSSNMFELCRARQNG